MDSTVHAHATALCPATGKPPSVNLLVARNSDMTVAMADTAQNFSNCCIIVSNGYISFGVHIYNILEFKYKF